MCGIAGSFGPPDDRAVRRVRQMLVAQSHRGPDGAGIAWCDRSFSWHVETGSSPGLISVGELPSTRVLGHNLLAIQDRTDAARQPMCADNVALTFNGEIYNFVELRAELEAEGVHFDTAGDTEVLLQLWTRRGPACLNTLRGMYAFAIADSRIGNLWLVRDPFGIKPLYYVIRDNAIIFASEIRALHAAGIPRMLDREAAVACAAAGINAFGADRTLYENIRQLPPGHLLVATNHGIDVRPYFSLPPIVADLRGNEATDALRAEMEASVRMHLRSRRKIATCLSGGLDSSGIASLIGQTLGEAAHEFQTFTICTGGSQDSELELASFVARKAGLRHELVVPAEISASDALEMTVAYEVPNHVIGPINQFLLLRQIAASGVTVVLDGQGGDELFSGYPWYAPVLLKEVAKMGGDAASLELKLREKFPLDPATMQEFERMFHDPPAWVNAFMWQGRFLSWSPHQVLELTPTQYYLHGGGDWRAFRERQYLRGELQYLLRQEDRLGMWFGLECRVPLVDVPLVRLAARLAPDWLIYDGYLKYPLRAALDQLPDPVRWNTRKRGFWETDRARFPWVAEVGRRFAAESTTLCEIFPTLAAEWETLSFDQHWRLLQLALLERCGTREEWHELRRENYVSDEHSQTSNRPLHLHIGHHFFGAGNLGDDLMLAGFLDAVSTSGSNVHLTCASAFNIGSQRRRFPQVEWLDYDLALRESAIRACDAWVGVGDTPFQIVVGPWFLEHLAAELELCRKHDKTMYFIGIGVNEPVALDDQHAHAVLDYATHVWTRDERSAELISAADPAAKVSPAADLAHIYLSHRPEMPVEIDAFGFVLNFEDPRQFDPTAFGELANRLGNRRQRWLVQEDRPLVGSERALYEALPEARKAQLDFRAPDYSNGTLDSMLASWGSPGTLITSRYHAAVIGAWSGARVVAIERSDKIRALAAQSGITTVPDLRDASAALSAIDLALPVARPQLMELARRASRACEDMMEQIASNRSSLANHCELASVEAKDSPQFHAFMSMMNGFATSFDLRTFTTWSKIWEYPWLWFSALGRINWAGKHVVDLGSEISPMPWFLATLGAKVTLIEVDEQWAPVWQKLCAQLQVDVAWHVVGSEAIPVPSASADVVTSFSVIEHQPNKRSAVDEVARVLKPGGVFAVSFDICEAEMGMTFPEWNGRALTLAEFEETLWLHPAFGNHSRPLWNRETIEPFLAWHRTTAPHHNYVAAAAVLVKSR